MGWNEVHFQIRGQILTMDPLPMIEKVYSMVIQDENQMGFIKPVSNDASYMFVPRTGSFQGQNYQGHQSVANFNGKGNNQT